MPESCLYRGEVVHRRFNPLRHELRYRVFNLFADVDGLADLSRRLRLFGYNRRNVFSVRDRDHGPGDGTPIREHAWGLVKKAEGGEHVQRIFMFCYPSVMGYVFNPLTVYYAYDNEDALRLMIYEVNNTFGGRHSYVIPVSDQPQTAPKRFFVSPFNAIEGRYGFRFNRPGPRMALGVNLSVNETPVLNAYVSGERIALNDRALLASFASVPFLTVKVIAAIHLQALKLWWKGLRLNARPSGPNHTVDFLPGTPPKP